MNTKWILYAFFCINLTTLDIQTSEQQSYWPSLSWAKQWLSNTWLVKQGQAVNKKMYEANTIEEKWHGKEGKYPYKESASRNPITDASKSANRFKQVLKDASRKDTTGHLSVFYDNPEKFLFGASSSSYQYEGGLDTIVDGQYTNANTRFYKQHKLGTPGTAIDFFNRFATDIEQMKKELGINSFRISIAWDRVAPREEEYDQSAILRYVAIIKKLKENNIEPIVVLHHYTVPTWFENIGGFEKSENIKHFVSFAEKMYDALYEDVTYWSTFNAIEGYAFKGYQTLDGPPGNPEKKGLYITEQVMANMLESHVQIYQLIKNQKNGLYYEKLQQNNAIPNPQIGIQKNIVSLDPLQKNAYLITQFASSAVSVIGEGAQNKGFFDFFTTGTFNVVTPKRVYHHNSLAPQSIDWIGVNVYSNMIMRFAQAQEEPDEDKATANKNYRDYPEGIYRAVEQINTRLAKPLSLPIFITENGIATQDDEKRTRFFQRTLFTIRMLIKEGYPIIGYTPWASHDNYEWPSKKQPNPFDRPYGFFKVDLNPVSPNYLKRTLKEGAHYYRDFIKQFFNGPKQEGIEIPQSLKE